jgi:phosphohistidine phosphatase
LTSPLVRADQTAQLLAEVLEIPRPVRLDALAGGSGRQVLEALSRYGVEDTVVLVGHEPFLGRLAASLAFGATGTLPLKKAGACCIQFDGAVQPGRGRLQWHVTPRILRRMARSEAPV